MAFQNYHVEERKDLRELLRASAAEFGDRTAICEKENGATVSYSYERLDSDVSALGTALWEKGLSGKRILILGSNSYAWTVSFFAVVCGLGCAVPVDPAFPAATVCEIAAKTDAAAIICSDELLHATDALEPSVLRISFGELSDLIREGSALRASDTTTAALDYDTAPIDADAMTAIFFTSGAHRGVMLSQKNLCFNAAGICRMIRFTPDDVFLSVLPIHHLYEMTCGLLCPLSQGCSVAFSEGLRHLSREMKEYRPTVLNCVPYLMESMYRKIELSIRRNGMERSTANLVRMIRAIRPEAAQLAAKKRAFSFVHRNFGGKLRLILTSGAPSDPAVLRGFRDFGILALQGYGLVECSPIAALNRDRFYRDSAAGLPMPGALVDIYDMQEDGIGEIRCKGSHVMLGYFGDPERTAAVLRNGWFYTGDLGYLDSDGFLHIIGRKQNTIITASGKKVFPEELEAMLNSTKYIREAAVTGVCDTKQEKVSIVAILCPDTDALREAEKAGFDPFGSDELRRSVAEVNAILPPFKRISSYVIRRDPLPRTPSGSLIRRELKF